jgi:signal transduction histidine kinase
MQEGSDVLWVEMDLRHQPILQVGQRILLEGRAVAGEGRIREVLVDNDGLHRPTEKTETVFLPAGRLPIEVAWFNGPANFALAVEYAGPGFSRQAIPDEALFVDDLNTTNRANHGRHGLTFRCYEGNWSRLPGFSALPALRYGTTNNFNLDVRTRDQRVGLDLSGYLEIPEAGAYTFWLTSDDGSRLYIGRTSLRLSALGLGPLPEWTRLTLGQPAKDYQPVEVEGMVTSVHRYSSGAWEAELSLGTNRIYLIIANGSGETPEILSWVRARGLYRSIQMSNQPCQAARLLVQDWNQVEVLTNTPTPMTRAVRHTAELRKLGAGAQPCFCALQLEGLVLATNSAGFFVLQDDTGTVLVQMNPQEQLPNAGQTIALQGTGAAEGVRVQLRAPVLVDNDGIHTVRERSGAMFLRAGMQPLHLSWFNVDAPSGLEIFYQGPGLPRQRLPATRLFHAEPEPGSNTPRWVPGLPYCCYEGNWAWCPDPGLLSPVQQATSSDPSPALASRPNEVGLEFTGFLDVPRDGVYTFWTRSDDGSLLLLDEDSLHLRVTGSQPIPAPVRLAPRQLPREDQDSQWSQVEGTVTFVTEERGGLGLDLSSETGRVHVQIVDFTNCSSLLLLNSRIRVTGVSQVAYSTDGQKVAGGIVTPGPKQIEFVEMAPEHWGNYPIVPLGSIDATNFAETVETVIHTQGQLYASAPDEPLTLVDADKSLLLDTTQPPPRTNGVQVEVLGHWTRAGSNIVLQSACYRELARQPDGGTNVLPLLSTIEQVKSLSREEAQRGYPVQIRGIITAPLLGGFFIQDSTWAIYVRWDEATNEATSITLHAGDYWLVKGQTFAEFAPNIRASTAVRLGPGTFPEPLRPAWDQLINGSLDTRYVELQGIVTTVDTISNAFDSRPSESLTLLTRSGKINVQVGARPGELRPYENALIRIRGCVVPARNDDTQQLEFGRVQLYNYSVAVDEPAPADPFDATLKHAADLLLFDPRAGAIQRVKVAGQIIHSHQGEYFLFERGTGMRFVPRAPVALKTGDRVEVAGFPELGGPSPVLREAVVRQTGHAPLPVPIELTPENILNAEHEATLVQVTARLVNVSFDGGQPVLELQADAHSFVARLDARTASRPLFPGSRLQLTGVYTGKGGDRTVGREIDSFELLLNSPADITVLQKPGWWTLRRLLAVLGIMAVVLLCAMLWAFILKRQVDAQTKVIRQKVETEAVLEERARIARDLHDTLEQALVGTSLQLNALATSLPNLSPTSSRILDMARSMVRHGQAEARRTVRNLRSVKLEKFDLPTALAQLAEQSKNGLPTKISMNVTGVARPLSSKLGSHLLRIGQEATTNAVKHANAKNIWIELDYQEALVRLSIRDDGCGFDAAHASSSEAGHFGLLGMRERAEKIAGKLKITSAAGQGTAVEVTVIQADHAQLSKET